MVVSAANAKQLKRKAPSGGLLTNPTRFINSFDYVRTVIRAVCTSCDI